MSGSLIRPRMSSIGGVRGGVAGLAVVAVLFAGTACGAPGAPAGAVSSAERPVPFADCAAVTAPPGVGPAPAGGSAAVALPALTLPCLAGGEPVALDRLRGPAVVNLWASWCEPCREELPMLQRYADRVVGRIRVIGVVTGDDRTRAIALGEELGVTFPALYDRDRQLIAAVGRTALPLTLFVDGTGAVTYLHNAAALDEGVLETLVEEHLGVVP